MNSANNLIFFKQSPIHGTGGFAKKDIPKGIKIIQYRGEKITKEESQRREKASMQKSQTDPSKGAVYIFELDDQFDIDGEVEYNYAKYINHSCQPNCRYEYINNEIWITSIKNIRKGEEITYNYGFNLDESKNHPCKCNSPNCIGYILAEDDWSKLAKTKEA